MMKEYLRLMRIKHYIKNGFILLPLFFAGKLFDVSRLSATLLAVVGFSFAASAVYILNDYFDIEHDRRHPTKRNRPLAAGAVNVRIALALSAALAIAGIGVVAMVSIPGALCIVLYLILNICYSLRLKHIPLIDVTIIAIGFVLRLAVGAAAAQVLLSHWIVLATFLLALFLGFAKRRDDLVIQEEDGIKVRNIDGYNFEMINASIIIMATLVIVSYLMYVLSPEVIKRTSDYLYITVVFVILGILRYFQVTFIEKKSGSPDKVILRDRFLQAVIGGWMLSFFILLY